MYNLHFFFVFVLLSSLQSTDRRGYGRVAADGVYTNPVFEPILADPTVVRDPVTRLFYAYGTQDDWGDGKGSRLIPVLESPDLVHWELVGEAFEKKPDWKREGGIWAPDVVQVDDHFLLYYAYSTWGDTNPGIGVAISKKPQGPFIDQGKLFDSQDIGVPNSIDPFYWEEDGTKYLFWGSYSKTDQQGTYGVELSSDGLNITAPSEKFKIAAGDFEAVVIHKREGWYYFIGSKGHCCNGARSDYHVLVARSKNLKGPYVDDKGRNVTERGHGTVLLNGNKAFVGTGHSTRIITDDKNQDWILYHGIDPQTGKVSSGASRRVLLLDKITWEDGWPRIESRSASFTESDAPFFKETK